jgi:hypothetical protein
MHLERLWLSWRLEFRHRQRVPHLFQSTGTQAVHILRDKRERCVWCDLFADGFYGKFGESNVCRIRIGGEGPETISIEKSMN